MAKRKEWRDPFADYIEWTQHRYDPGYYLGGRIPPHLRKANLGWKGRRNAGVLLLVSGALGLAGILPYAALMGAGALLEASVPVLVIAAGVAMLRTHNRADRPTTRDT